MPESMKGRYHYLKGYEFGDGCRKNARLAFHWYQKAAENGNDDAKKIVARGYGRLNRGK
jgi:TPR repeat protein